MVWRLLRRLQKPRIDTAPAPAIRFPKNDWVVGCPRPASLLAPDTLCFLNEAHGIDTPADWNANRLEKLWLYNAHYFDDLNARGASDRISWHLRLIKRWLQDNPPGYGIGWEPYPLSLRIVNWIKFDMATGKLDDQARESLAVQIRCLRSQLEFHLLGNHLLANAKALIFAGAYFEGNEASRWLDIGLKILRSEIKEQVLPDGGHFERSPMYHALILEDLLDIRNVMHAYSLASMLPEMPVTAMREWLRTLCHPDGGIAFFNDAAFGISPEFAELEAYSGRLGLGKLPLQTSPLIHLRESGYLRMASGPAVVLLDLAPVGPDYLPGHAHADTLSFELSLYGQRILVNSGTSCYGIGEQRQLERGTSAHNTLAINDENSSEVWAGFRVARRAMPQVGAIEASPAALQVKASHDGYRHLPGHNIHHRHWRLSTDSLAIVDEVEGAFESAKAYLHFHPSVTLLRDCDEHAAFLRLPDKTEITVSVSGGELRSEEGQWHPEFGISTPAIRLVVTLKEKQMIANIRWKVPD